MKLGKIAVIRLRGSRNAPKKVERALEMLGLDRRNYCTIVDSTPQNKGSLLRITAFAAFGEITLETLEKLLHKRGKVSGGRALTDEYLGASTRFKSVADFAREFFEGKASWKDVTGLKRFFALNSPRKGIASAKKIFPKGALGNWGNKIGVLLEKMI
jgi:large subunit ribosomal protein L30